MIFRGNKLPKGYFGILLVCFSLNICEQQFSYLKNSYKSDKDAMILGQQSGPKAWNVYVRRNRKQHY